MKKQEVQEKVFVGILPKVVLDGIYEYLLTRPFKEVEQGVEAIRNAFIIELDRVLPIMQEAEKEVEEQAMKKVKSQPQKGE